MNYEEAKQKLGAYGQEHALQYWDELSDMERQNLLCQIDALDFSPIHFVKDRGEFPAKGDISPLKAMELPEIEDRREELGKTGLQAIREGKVGAVLLAGGMGTRLGSDNPKCMYDIGITRHVYIMQRLIENLLEQQAARAAGGVPAGLIRQPGLQHRKQRIQEQYRQV